MKSNISDIRSDSARHCARDRRLVGLHSRREKRTIRRLGHAGTSNAPRWRRRRSPADGL